jgi:hypothetical protein
VQQDSGDIEAMTWEAEAKYRPATAMPVSPRNRWTSTTKGRCRWSSSDVDEALEAESDLTLEESDDDDDESVDEVDDDFDLPPPRLSVL